MVHRNTLNVPRPRIALRPRLHHGLGVFVAEAVIAHGNALGRLWAVVQQVDIDLIGVLAVHEHDELLHVVNIGFGAHGPAAAPHLVANADIFHLERLGMAIGHAVLLQRGGLVGGHIFHPVGRLLGSAGTDIDRDIGLGADLVGEIHKFGRAKSVWLHHTAPHRVEPRRALGSRAHAITPIITIGKAAARPAHHGHLDGAQSRNHIAADAAHIGDAGILADPDATIDALTQMLGKLAKDVAIDHRAGLIGLHHQRAGRCCGARRCGGG